MNARPAIAAVTLLTLSWSAAQNVAQEPPEDPVQEAIREFNRQDSGKTNEVTVVADPVVSETIAKPEPAPGKSAEKPVLVTGRPPEGAELAKEEDQTPKVPEMVMEQPASQPQKGLAVHVEKLQTGTGPMDPSKVKLLAPFPAKLLSPAPAGWRLESSENAPPFTREVELSPGKKITLKVRPHLLVPEADGASVFNVSEPGFDNTLGYRQDATVGAVLSTSIRELDEDSKHLGAAIDNLQQLLVSLPKPEPVPAPPPAPTPNRKR
jgi:hypothetical protein